jgi:hypothetical protein
MIKDIDGTTQDDGDGGTMFYLTKKSAELKARLLKRDGNEDVIVRKIEVPTDRVGLITWLIANASHPDNG